MVRSWALNVAIVRFWVLLSDDIGPRIFAAFDVVATPGPERETIFEELFPAPVDKYCHDHKGHMRTQTHDSNVERKRSPRLQQPAQELPPQVLEELVPEHERTEEAEAQG